MKFQLFQNRESYIVDGSMLIQGDDLQANFERLWPQARHRFDMMGQALFDHYVNMGIEPASGYKWALAVFCKRLGAPCAQIPRIPHENPDLAKARFMLRSDPDSRRRALAADYGLLQGEYLQGLLDTKSETELRALAPMVREIHKLVWVALILGESSFNPNQWELIASHTESDE